MLAQSKKELKRQHLQKSPQGILYHMQDGYKQVFVPQSPWKEIMKEHHDIPLIGHVGVECIGLWTTSTERFGGKPCGMMFDNIYDPIQYVNS